MVKNQEWMYLFEEETRNSIMIEWYFTNKKNLQDVIQWKKEWNHSDKILWYFEAATLLYEFGYQKWKNNDEAIIGLSEIKTIHSLMFKYWSPEYRTGERRKWNIMINKAKINPPYGVMIDQMMEYFVSRNKKNIGLGYLPEQLAKMHTLFESIHPFEDGNGRVGRIIINYLLLIHWLPNIIIKWTEKAKDNYFLGLELAEKGLNNFFPGEIPQDNREKDGDFSLLTSIIEKALFHSMDYLITSRLNENELVPLSDLVVQNGYSADYGRKLIERGLIIAKKIGKQRHSHPDLFYKKKNEQTQ